MTTVKTTRLYQPHIQFNGHDLTLMPSMTGGPHTVFNEKGEIIGHIEVNNGCVSLIDLEFMADMYEAEPKG